MHPAETYRTVDLVSYTRSTRLANGSVKFSATNGRSGTVEKGGRSATIHVPADQYGWRNPSAYSGWREVHKTNRPPITAYRSYATWKFPPNGWAYVDGVLVPNTELVVILARSAALGASQSLAAEARMKALLGFKDVKVDLSVAFAERKKTANLLTKRAMQIARLAWDIRKGKFDRYKPKKKFDGVTHLANTWLEYRYAWTPLLLDVYGSARALAERDDASYKRYLITTRGRAKSTKSWPKSSYSPMGHFAYIGGDPASVQVASVCSAASEHEFRARYDACLTRAEYRRLQDVGVTDPLTTHWELLPYSFVCDWFLGIGDFLSAVNALRGYTWRGGSGTAYYKGVESQDIQYVDNSYTGGTLTLPKVRRVEVEGFNREVYTTAPTASIVLKRNPLNLTRAADAISLLWTAFGRKKSRDFSL